jgi:hypothetical protein
MLYGGLASNVCNDLRVYDGGENKWTKVGIVEQGYGYSVSARFGHSLHLYNNKLIIYGGSGKYIDKLKCRQTLSDVRILDLSNHTYPTLTLTFIGTNNWDDTDYSREKGTKYGKKRVNHASTLFGGIMMVHGGASSEDKILYSDFEAFDLGKQGLKELIWFCR